MNRNQKIKITPSKLPVNSLLNKRNNMYDYIDSFESVFIDNEKKVKPADVGKLFFSGGPKWIDTLLVLRNNIVKIFGIKTPENFSDRQKLLDQFKCETGEQLGLFEVFDKTENEVVLGEDNKHLNFRVSLFLDGTTKQPEKRTLTISTVVTFNNWLGRFYFSPVKPFHKLIVPTILKGMIQKLESPIT